MQVYSAEIRAGVTVGKGNGVQRDLVGCLQSDDGRVWQLCYTEILRVWNQRAETDVGPAYPWSCDAAVTANVWVSHRTEGIGEYSSRNAGTVHVYSFLS